MAAFDIVISEDRHRVRFCCPKNEIAIDLTAEELSALIASLGDARAEMAEPQPTLRTGDLPAILSPKWNTAANVDQVRSVLQLRDPRFGWLCYTMPPHEATYLAKLLKNQVDELLSAVKSPKRQ